MVCFCVCQAAVLVDPPGRQHHDAGSRWLRSVCASLFLAGNTNENGIIPA